MHGSLKLALLALLPIALAVAYAYFVGCDRGREKRQREVTRELEERWPR